MRTSEDIMARASVARHNRYRQETERLATLVERMAAEVKEPRFELIDKLTEINNFLSQHLVYYGKRGA